MVCRLYLLDGIPLYTSMKMKFCFSLVLCSFLNPVFAQYFKTSVSLIGSANFASYNFIEREGNFIQKKGNFNLGFGADVAYYFNVEKKLFVKTGVRLVTLKSGLTANHLIDGVSGPAVPGLSVPALEWQFRYFQISVPIYFGKTFTPFRNSLFYIDGFIGGTLGNIQTESYYWHTQIAKTVDNDEIVGAGVEGPRSETKFDNRFSPTLDIGITFPVIPSYPKLNFSIIYSHHLNRSAPVRQDGFVANATQNISQAFYFKMNNKFNNILFSLNYTFGKKWRKNIIHQEIKNRKN